MISILKIYVPCRYQYTINSVIGVPRGAYQVWLRFTNPFVTFSWTKAASIALSQYSICIFNSAIRIYFRFSLKIDQIQWTVNVAVIPSDVLYVRMALKCKRTGITLLTHHSLSPRIHKFKFMIMCLLMYLSTLLIQTICLREPIHIIFYNFTCYACCTSLVEHNEKKFVIHTRPTCTLREIMIFIHCDTITGLGNINHYEYTRF